MNIIRDLLAVYAPRVPSPVKKKGSREIAKMDCTHDAPTCPKQESLYAAHRVHPARFKTGRVNILDLKRHPLEKDSLYAYAADMLIL